MQAGIIASVVGGVEAGEVLACLPGRLGKRLLHNTFPVIAVVKVACVLVAVAVCVAEDVPCMHASSSLLSAVQARD